MKLLIIIVTILFINGCDMANTNSSLQDQGQDTIETVGQAEKKLTELYQEYSTKIQEETGNLSKDMESFLEKAKSDPDFLKNLSTDAQAQLGQIDEIYAEFNQKVDDIVAKYPELENQSKEWVDKLSTNLSQQTDEILQQIQSSDIVNQSKDWLDGMSKDIENLSQKMKDQFKK